MSISEIEFKRKELELLVTVQNFNLSDPRVLKASQELDSLLNRHIGQQEFYEQSREAQVAPRSVTIKREGVCVQDYSYRDHLLQLKDNEEAIIHLDDKAFLVKVASEEEIERVPKGFIILNYEPSN